MDLQAAWEVYRRTRFANPNAVPAILAEVGAQDAGIADYLPEYFDPKTPAGPGTS